MNSALLQYILDVAGSFRQVYLKDDLNSFFWNKIIKIIWVKH